MNKVDVFSYRDTGNGPEFEKLQSISTTSANVDQAHDAASGMCLSPDHHYLFTSTAGDNTVAMFHIDPETGCLEKKFALPISGEYPKDIAMFPDGNISQWQTMSPTRSQHLPLIMRKTCWFRKAAR